MSAKSIIYEIESLEKEIDYYKKSLKEAQRVIQQLAFGVPEGEAELIHPADMMEIYERCDRVFVDLSPAEPLDPHVVVVGENRYQQSMYAPKRMKNIV